MWQTKYAATIPKNLGLGLNFGPCSEGYFLSGRPYSVVPRISGQMEEQFIILCYLGKKLFLPLTFHLYFDKLILLMWRPIHWECCKL